MLLAVLLRVAAMCFGAALLQVRVRVRARVRVRMSTNPNPNPNPHPNPNLQRFGWLKIVLGTVLLLNGLRALALAAAAPPDEDAAPPPSPRQG